MGVSSLTPVYTLSLDIHIHTYIHTIHDPQAANQPIPRLRYTYDCSAQAADGRQPRDGPCFFAGAARRSDRTRRIKQKAMARPKSQRSE
mmetsp:Transcript_21803/g.53439  ORF Transcript_21803/g.53439 Transcript_21803/m.53439 type:complete len:89 (+) Transcript_21803:788-1054(+)